MNTMMLYVSGASTQPPWQLIGIGLLVVILACPLAWILSVIWPKPGETDSHLDAISRFGEEQGDNAWPESALAEACHAEQIRRTKAARAALDQTPQ